MLLQFTTISFVIITAVIFQLIRGEKRQYVLLAASLLFIAIEGGTMGIVSVLFSTVLAWKVGTVFFDEKSPGVGRGKQKAAAVSAISLLSLILFGWKYIPWAASQFGIDISTGVLSVPVPIGLSFYTFQAISYIADLYAGRMTAEKSFLKFAIYMTWFPKWMSGPIERAGSFIEQLKYSGDIRAYSFKRITWALSYFVWGLVLKLMIADKIAIVVDHVFTDLDGAGSIALLLTSLLYTVQIYCDFAGYTNIVIGISKLFGIDLTQNFRTPYMAENITDFWRRWHISLSNFLRDYIYIPLGGNRKGPFRKWLNTLVVFLICGMWHGAGLSFIVWGLLHAALSILASLVAKTKLSWLLKGGVGRAVNFVCVSFAWIFFRAESLSQAALFIRGMVPSLNVNALMSGFATGEGITLGLGTLDWWIIGICVLILIAVDAYAYRKDTTAPEVMIERFSDNRRMVLLSVILSVVLIFGEYGAGDEIRRFVYMNF